jgi:hypothetical protein
MRCDDVRSVYELPKDFSVYYDDVRSVYELPKDFSVYYDDVRSVYELPKDFSVYYDDVRALSNNDEVLELCDDHLQVAHGPSQTRFDVSYVPACITPYALKAISHRSRDCV